jgi:hypothetical protein
MGEWKTAFDGEVIGRPVKIEIYGDQDDPNTPNVRVTSPEATPEVRSVGGAAMPGGGAVLIEVDNVGDLIGELEAVGFSQAQIDEIVGHLPE